MVFILRILVWIFGTVFKPFQRKGLKNGVMECLVVGYGGANNTGAEARTVEAIKQMLDADPRIHITLTSIDCRQTLRYISENERLHVAQVQPVFLISVFRLVFKSDMVVLVEGSCFKDNFSSALLWFFMYAAELAQRLAKPTLCYAVDAGKMKPANAGWARDVANKMDIVMTRTLAAANLLKTIGVNREIKVTTDTAFTQMPIDNAEVDKIFSSQGIDPKKPVVGIAFEELFWWPVVVDVWRAIRGIREDHYKSIYYHSWGEREKAKSREMKKTVAMYADFVAQEYGAQIVFFAMEALDANPCTEVQGLMKNPSALFDADHYNAAQMTGLLRRLEWLVTSRYHALVLSMEGAIPIIGLAHDERIESIMKELGLHGDYFINYREEDIPAKLGEKTKNLVNHKTEISQKIRDAMPSYFSRMEMNKKHFKSLVDSRFPH